MTRPLSFLATVSPFTILVDTMEKQPWTFREVPGEKGKGRTIVKTEWQSLGKGYGDYTIKGSESKNCRWRLSIERKSLTDLYSTILGRRRQFLNELVNLNEMEYAAVIVESELQRVYKFVPQHWKEQELSVETQLGRQRSVIGSIQAWQLRFPVVRWWFLPRKSAEVWAYRLLHRFWIDRIQEAKDV